MDTPQLIGILAFLTFGAAIAASIKRGGMWLQRAVGLGHKMAIRTKDGRTVAIENASITLNDKSVRTLMARNPTELTPGDPEPADEFQRKCREVLAKTTDESRAKYAFNTFRAYATGLMKKVLEIDEEVSMRQFDEVVGELLGPQRQDGIPHLEQQLSAAFADCPPADDEFLIGWADRVVLTNRRLIITSTGSQPRIEHVVALAEIESFAST